MDTKKLKKLLDQLQVELDHTEKISSEEIKLKLETLKSEIDSLLKYSSKNYDILEEFKQGVDEFEKNHSKEISTLDRLFDSLSRMGI